ncbi:hypothetical protein [Caloranaerobacter ferrireducens]|uniref:hypothetical protein n=1 Tax=Caloranaerobacter ferrireducens TaxID=1323370 RepID=UPI00084DB8AE|nr:hypothetical protein [Caloranaerobacter ferrireducens]
MRYKKILLLFISICILISFYTLAYADNIDKTRAKVDRSVTKVVKLIGYTIILLVAIKEVIQKAQAGDLQAIGSVVIKYLIIYAVLLGLPTALKWVEEFIEGLK